MVCPAVAPEDLIGEPLTVTVPEGALDLVTGATTGATLELGRYGVAVLATPRAAAPPFLTLAP